MTDWQVPATEDPGQDDEEAVKVRTAEHQAKVAEFFAAMDADALRRKKVIERWKPARCSNRYFVLALDNALTTGLGFGLEFFRANRASFALQAGQVRWLIPNPTPSPDDASHRSVVGKRSEGTGRLEHTRVMKEGREWRPTLHFSQDEGSIGLPGSMWLLAHCRIRGSLTEDEWHRTINDISDATRECGCWTLVLEWGCVANFRGGPWRGATFLQKVKGACDVYFRDCSIEDDLFKLLYERLAVDFNCQDDLDFGSQAHRRKVWDLAAAHKSTLNQGQKMKLGRWGSWFMAQEQLRSGRHTLLLGLVLVGIEQGWWPSLASSPLFRVTKLTAEEDVPPGAGEGDVAASAAPAADADEPVRSTVAASNKEMASLKSACHNTMHFAAMVLANPVGAQLVDLLCEASLPARLNFWDGIKACSSRDGARQRDVNLAILGKAPRS